MTEIRDDSLSHLISTLKTADSIEERRNAAIELSNLQHPDSIEPLIESLQDHEDVAVFSTFALVQIGEECISLLINKGIKSVNPKIRTYAAEILGELNAHHSAEILIDLFHQEQDENSKITIIEALGHMDHPAITDFLINTLDNPNNSIVIAAALALHRKQIPIQLCELLTKKINTVGNREQGFLAWALIEICDRHDREKLLSMSQSVEDKNLKTVIQEVIKGISLK